MSAVLDAFSHHNSLRPFYSPIILLKDLFAPRTDVFSQPCPLIRNSTGQHSVLVWRLHPLRPTCRRIPAPAIIQPKAVDREASTSLTFPQPFTRLNSTTSKPTSAPLTHTEPGWFRPALTPKRHCRESPPPHSRASSPHPPSRPSPLRIHIEPRGTEGGGVWLEFSG